MTGTPGDRVSANPGTADCLERFATAVGDLAHGFNNALTTVVGLTDWHLVSQPHGDALREDLERIRAAAISAEGIARQIQQLAREAAGESAPVPLAATPGLAAPTMAVSEANRRVLLVDDQADVRASLAVMIRTLGYEVHPVDGGRAAMEWLRAAPTPPAVVITDLSMPEMDGQELAAAITQSWSGVPVVLLTGWAGSGPGPSDTVARVLAKPLRMGRLREALADLIGAPAA